VLTYLQLYLLLYIEYITRLQTRFNAGPTLIHSTASKSIPFEDAINFNEEVSSVPTQNNSNNDRSKTLKSIAKYAFTFVTIVSVITALSPGPANAAAKAATESVEHLHVGQKIANYFRSFGIPDLAVLAIISAMPVVELRGAVPVGGKKLHIYIHTITDVVINRYVCTAVLMFLHCTGHSN